MEQNYEYWEREKVAARQKDLKVLVDTLCRSMKEKGITEYIFGKPMCIKKCGRDMGSYIQVDKLFLKENGRGIDMQYILCDYIADNPIVRRCSIKQVITSNIEFLIERLITEGLIEDSVKDSMAALLEYEVRYKEYLNS